MFGHEFKVLSWPYPRLPALGWEVSGDLGVDAGQGSIGGVCVCGDLSGVSLSTGELNPCNPEISSKL